MRPARPVEPPAPARPDRSAYLLLAPFLVVFLLFGLGPLVWTGVTALHRVELTDPAVMEWVGARNLRRLATDEFFLGALWTTVVIGVLSTVPQLALALWLAELLRRGVRGGAGGLFRVALLAPYATSVAAATLVFALLFGADRGPVNAALGWVGVTGPDWQNQPLAARVAVSSIIVWRWTGYNALLYLAAAQAVPAERYEAAALDGAGAWRQFAHVTLPALRPTILFTCVVSAIGATQVFGEPLLFAGGSGASGGAEHQVQTLGLYLYEQGWVNLHLGRAAAIAWAMVAVAAGAAGSVALVGRVVRARERARARARARGRVGVAA
ncbi:carbohydrate ABC transporter permease [Streptomyces sp. BI20]|uniref:carbohydrate ABC transporter permease n=1 Tax=Streptomyces sp. BI20 TaxID=3403460 RepID=UPI003C7681F4